MDGAVAAQSARVVELADTLGSGSSEKSCEFESRPGHQAEVLDRRF
jgi:hypothetical protein